jgi:hypothetical protein
MEHGGPLPHSQKFTLGPYLGPVQSISHLPIILFNNSSLDYYSHIYSYMFQLV